MRLVLAALALAASAVPTPAQTYTGTLDSSDPTDPGRDAPYEAHSFEADRDQIVTVRMTAAFDTYLTVERPDGGEAYTNDDFDGVSVSQVEFVAPAAGTYTVRAGAYSASTLEQTSGDYEVTVTRGGTARTELVAGRLDRQDQQALKGEFYDEAEFQTRAGGRVIVELEPLGFNGFLIVTTPSGRVVRTGEDGMGSPDANGRMRIGPLDAEAGTYRVAVTTMGPGEVGAYDLRFLRFEQ